MWCIGALTQEYRARMYKLLALYAKPLRHDEPVLCIDEKSMQLIAHSRKPLPMLAGPQPSRTMSTFAKVRPTCSWRWSLRLDCALSR